MHIFANPLPIITRLPSLRETIVALQDRKAAIENLTRMQILAPIVLCIPGQNPEFIVVFIYS